MVFHRGVLIGGAQDLERWLGSLSAGVGRLRPQSSLLDVVPALLARRRAEDSKSLDQHHRAAGRLLADLQHLLVLGRMVESLCLLDRGKTHHHHARGAP